IIYTSGSTATPKGVVSCHRQVVFVARAIQSRLGYRADDVVFCALPLSFDYGLYQVYLCVLAGACLVLADESDSGATLVATLNRCQATVLPLVAPMAATLVALVARTSRAPAALRLITSSGASLDDALARGLRTLLPNAVLVGMFGLTECKRVTVGEPQELIAFPGSCGRALPDTEIYVIDDRGNRLPPGEVGELVVRGPHVMSGYWGDPLLTAARFPRDELGEARLRTGDQCRIDADGRLYFVGRADDIYKQRGFRVSILEVEAAALRVPGVRAAAALPPENGGGAVLVVEGDLTPIALRVGMSQHIEDLTIPEECHVLRALPVGPNGKIDKRGLRTMLAAS
ncbi:MAG TPA: AMP-binding protein, partial [Pseudonocardiaceae bacterium]